MLVNLNLNVDIIDPEVNVISNIFCGIFFLIDRILTERGFVVIVRLVELAVIYKSIYNSTRETHVNHT